MGSPPFFLLNKNEPPIRCLQGQGGSLEGHRTRGAAQKPSAPGSRTAAPPPVRTAGHRCANLLLAAGKIPLPSAAPPANAVHGDRAHAASARNRPCRAHGSAPAPPCAATAACVLAAASLADPIADSFFQHRRYRFLWGRLRHAAFASTFLARHVAVKSIKVIDSPDSH